MSTAALTQTDYEVAAATLNCEAEVLQAFVLVAFPGPGILPGNYVARQFNTAYFSNLTEGKFDGLLSTSLHAIQAQPSNCIPVGVRQFTAASIFDADAAARATAWGRFGIYGGDCAFAGYESINEMVSDFGTGESAQLIAWAVRMADTSWAVHLHRKDWHALAFCLDRRATQPQIDATAARIKAAYAALIAPPLIAIPEDDETDWELILREAMHQSSADPYVVSPDLFAEEDQAAARLWFWLVVICLVALTILFLTLAYL